MSEEEEPNNPPPPGIHEPYELVESLPLEAFNARAGILGFQPRKYCEGKPLPWRREPTFSHCSHFSTVYTTSKLRYHSTATSPASEHCSFEVPLEGQQAICDIIDLKAFTFVKLVPVANQDFILALFDENKGKYHKGIIFDTLKDTVFGTYEVNSEAQYSARNVRQLLIMRNTDVISLVVEKALCRGSRTHRTPYEIWSYIVNKNHPPNLDLLHVHNSIEGSMRFHGPLFTSVPGKGVELYCAAFFKDPYRLKDLYGNYFIALVNAKQNRYFKVKGPQGLGLRAWDWAIKICHMQSMEASSCGNYLAITLENFAGRSTLIILLETATLTAIKVFPQVRQPVGITAQPLPMNASCFLNCRITFSRCTTLLSMFSHTSNIASLGNSEPNVNIYQLPLTITLANLCRIYLRRRIEEEQIHLLPLPQALVRFVACSEPAPKEEEYIETAMGLRSFDG